MKEIKFEITHRGNTYHVYVERGLDHEFKRKHHARKFVEKYKAVVNDNVLVMGAINEQVNTLYRMYYPWIDSRICRELCVANDDFNDCYNRIYNPLKNYVQFIQIRASFNYLESRLMLMKRFAQKHKMKVLLSQIYPWIKTFELIYTQYNNDIQGLTNGVNYRTQLRKIALTDTNKNEPEPNNSRQLS